METLKILILAIVQGLTEFLPVSSSGHTVVLKNLFGFSTEAGPALEILLHAGTLLSVLVYYRKKLTDLALGIFKKDPQSWIYGLWVVISAIPAMIVYGCLGDGIDRVFSNSTAVACLLMATGLILISTRFAWSRTTPAPIGWKRALLIGIAQAVAILPGISRSGSTISAAKWLKVKTEDAFEFSFIMSIPVLAGGILLKLKDLSQLSNDLGTGSAALLIAFLASSVVGYFSLVFIVKCGFRGKFWMFGIYCLAAGALALCLNH